MQSRLLSERDIAIGAYLLDIEAIKNHYDKNDKYINNETDDAHQNPISSFITVIINLCRYSLDYIDQRMYAADKVIKLLNHYQNNLLSAYAGLTLSAFLSEIRGLQQITEIAEEIKHYENNVREALHKSPRFVADCFNGEINRLNFAVKDGIYTIDEMIDILSEYRTILSHDIFISSLKSLQTEWQQRSDTQSYSEKLQAYLSFLTPISKHDRLITGFDIIHDKKRELWCPSQQTLEQTINQKSYASNQAYRYLLYFIFTISMITGVSADERKEDADMDELPTPYTPDTDITQAVNELSLSSPQHNMPISQYVTLNYTVHPKDGRLDLSFLGLKVADFPSTTMPFSNSTYDKKTKTTSLFIDSLDVKIDVPHTEEQYYANLKRWNVQFDNNISLNGTNSIHDCGFKTIGDRTFREVCLGDGNDYIFLDPSRLNENESVIIHTGSGTDQILIDHQYDDNSRWFYILTGPGYKNISGNQYGSLWSVTLDMSQYINADLEHPLITQVDEYERKKIILSKTIPLTVDLRESGLIRQIYTAKYFNSYYYDHFEYLISRPPYLTIHNKTTRFNENIFPQYIETDENKKWLQGERTFIAARYNIAMNEFNKNEFGYFYDLKLPEMTYIKSSSFYAVDVYFLNERKSVVNRLIPLCGQSSNMEEIDCKDNVLQSFSTKANKINDALSEIIWRVYTPDPTETTIAEAYPLVTNDYMSRALIPTIRVQINRSYIHEASLPHSIVIEPFGKQGDFFSDVIAKRQDKVLTGKWNSNTTYAEKNNLIDYIESEGTYTIVTFSEQPWNFTSVFTTTADGFACYDIYRVRFLPQESWHISKTTALYLFCGFSAFGVLLTSAITCGYHYRRKNVNVPDNLLSLEKILEHLELKKPIKRINYFIELLKIPALTEHLPYDQLTDFFKTYSNTSLLLAVNMNDVATFNHLYECIELRNIYISKKEILLQGLEIAIKIDAIEIFEQIMEKLLSFSNNLDDNEIETLISLFEKASHDKLNMVSINMLHMIYRYYLRISQVEKLTLLDLLKSNDENNQSIIEKKLGIFFSQINNSNYADLLDFSKTLLEHDPALLVTVFESHEKNYDQLHLLVALILQIPRNDIDFNGDHFKSLCHMMGKIIFWSCSMNLKKSDDELTTLFSTPVLSNNDRNLFIISLFFFECSRLPKSNPFIKLCICALYEASVSFKHLLKQNYDIKDCMETLREFDQFQLIKISNLKQTDLNTVAHQIKRYQTDLIDKSSQSISKSVISHYRTIINKMDAFKTFMREIKMLIPANAIVANPASSLLVKFGINSIKAVQQSELSPLLPSTIDKDEGILFHV